MNFMLGSSSRGAGSDRIFSILRWRFAPGVALFALCACSATPDPGNQQHGSGGSAGNASGSGGSKMSSGGGGSGNNAKGGSSNSAGGSSNGGSASQAGNTSSNGGQSTSNGGQSGSSGGSQNASGGSQNANGGSTSGGSTSGGSSNGGSSSGGKASGGTSSGTGGASGGATHRDHCIDGYDPDPSDANMADGPAEFLKSNQIDLTVQPGVINWMQAHVWQEAHFQWHNIRRCTSGMVDRTRAGGLDPCKHTSLVPADQEGKGAGDGLQFLAMHRHMIQSLKQLFPKHAAQFEGFEHFPTKASDLPKQWQADWSSWASNIATAGAKADDPAAHMNEPGFESEGAFGQWIQTTSGLHGALHFKWVRPLNTEHGLGNQFTNIDNFMFWKMHGWIDKVWDRYRAAKGKKPTDQDIKDAVLAQCRQMDALALLVKPDLNTGECTPAPKQTGTFVDTVRPIFESSTNKCTGCHGRTGANANLTLGGSDCVKSSDIVAALVNKQSATGGQFKLVVPGDPDKSWLYLKVTNRAATAGCQATSTAQCLTGVMPPGGVVTLTQAEQDALRKWIQDGAQAPQ